jgi:hypothetical protein
VFAVVDFLDAQHVGLQPLLDDAVDPGLAVLFACVDVEDLTDRVANPSAGLHVVAQRFVFAGCLHGLLHLSCLLHRDAVEQIGQGDRYDRADPLAVGDLNADGSHVERLVCRGC